MSGTFENMKQFLVFASLLLISLPAYPIGPDKELNPAFDEIYQSLVSPEDSSELIGQNYTLELSLKFASEKHLLFHDAYMRTSDVERYQIAKWQFVPETAQSVVGQRDIKCSVTFNIKQVQKTGAYAAMPHIVVDITHIAPATAPHD